MRKLFKSVSFVFILNLLLVIQPVAAADFGPAKNPDKFNTFLWPTLGQGKNSSWYEWWYSKVVDPTTGRAFFFVYEVVNPWDTGANPQSVTRAAVTFGDFGRKMQVTKSVPVTEFRAALDRYDVEIGNPAVATADSRHLQGRLVSEIGEVVSWDLVFEDPWSFRAMGWATGIPGLLNIGWYPAQASAKVSGTIRIGDETIHLERAPGYQDRNWGKSFPKWWSWIVANHWNEGGDAVLVAGGGAPEILGRPSPYEGMSVGFRYEGKLYTFRPTEGIFPKSDISFGKWEVSARDHFGNRIEISANAPLEKFMDLQFLTPQGEIFHDWEALAANVRVKFTPFGKPAVTLTTSLGGIEYGSRQQSGL